MQSFDNTVRVHNNSPTNKVPLEPHAQGQDLLRHPLLNVDLSPVVPPSRTLDELPHPLSTFWTPHPDRPPSPTSPVIAKCAKATSPYPCPAPLANQQNSQTPSTSQAHSPDPSAYYSRYYWWEIIAYNIDITGWARHI
jgi:hypothetical protein